MQIKPLQPKKARDLRGKTAVSRISPLFRLSDAQRFELFKAYWNSAREHICFFDKNLNFIDANPSGIRGLRRKRRDLINRHILEIFPYLKNSERFEKYQEILRTGKSFVIDEMAHPFVPGRVISVYIFRIKDGLAVIGENVTKNCRLKSRLKSSVELLESLVTHNQALREEESRRIAREVHDEMSPTLTTLKMDLCWLIDKWKNGESRPAFCEKKAAEMISLIDNSIASIRKICSELRPALLDDLGLFDAMEWHVEESRRRYPISWRIDINCDGLKLDESLSICVFRIFQEGFTNVLRHAQATKATISLKHRPSSNALILKIKDNGRGIRPEEISDPKSFGLIGMNDRIRAYQGRMTLRGVSGKGTTLEVTIPLSKKSADGQR